MKTQDDALPGKAPRLRHQSKRFTADKRHRLASEAAFQLAKRGLQDADCVVDWFELDEVLDGRRPGH